MPLECRQVTLAGVLEKEREVAGGGAGEGGGGGSGGGGARGAAARGGGHDAAPRSAHSKAGTHTSAASISINARALPCAAFAAITADLIFVDVPRHGGGGGDGGGGGVHLEGGTAVRGQGLGGRTVGGEWPRMAPEGGRVGSAEKFCC